MINPTPTPSPTDIDWLRSLASSGRDKEDVIRLAKIKFGHIWEADVTEVVDAITMDLLEDNAKASDATQAIANALEAIDEPSENQGTGISSMTGS